MDIEWKKLLPLNNRTIARMITIASGTFCLVDLGDAAIRAGIESGGSLPTFLSKFILRVNFVGVGRFVIACGTDAYMGIKKEVKRNERIKIMGEQINLLNAKVFYKQENMWLAAESTCQTIEQVEIMARQAGKRFVEEYEAMKRSMSQIDDVIPEVQRNNPELVCEMKDILRWG